MGTREIRHRPLDQWHYIRALVVMRHVGDHQRHGSCVNAANGSHKKSPPHSILFSTAYTPCLCCRLWLYTTEFTDSLNHKPSIANSLGKRIYIIISMACWLNGVILFIFKKGYIYLSIEFIAFHDSLYLSYNSNY